MKSVKTTKIMSGYSITHEITSPEEVIDAYFVYDR